MKRKIIKVVLISLGILSGLACTAMLVFYLLMRWLFGGDQEAKKYLVAIKYPFYKDSTHCFFKDQLIPNCKPTTAIALDENYIADADSIFFCSSETNLTSLFPPLLKTSYSIFTVKEADRATFSALGFGYSKDKRHAYLKGKSFAAADLPSLKACGRYFACDNVQVYYSATRINGSDGKSFQLIDTSFQGYAKDKKFAYYFTTHEAKRIYCYPSSFEKVGRSHARDIKGAYYLSAKITAALPDSFHELNDTYSADVNSVFYESEKILSADVASFKLANGNYSVDKNNVFWRSQKISGADPTSFQVLERDDYAKDRNRAYWHGKILDGADPASFVTRSDSYVAHDKNYEYNEGVKSGPSQ